MLRSIPLFGKWALAVTTIAFLASTLIGGGHTIFTSAATPGTALAFRTSPGAVSIAVGQSLQLGSVDVSPFRQIRVVADERVGSPTNVTIRITITEGNELVAQLDTLTLTPQSQVTRVYAVPGTKLTIFADASGGGGGSDAVDVLIYGSD